MSEINGNILVIEDRTQIRRVIRDYLEADGYEIYEAEDGVKGVRMFKELDIDLVILDIMMPGDDGWTVCRKIREISDVIVVMLTAKSEEDDKLMGYELGADDYVTKPFSPKVLCAKVNALLGRRQRKDGANDKIPLSQSLFLDRMGRKVFLKEKAIKLTSKEYELLDYLYENRNIALSREQLLDGVWGADFEGGDRTVDTTVKRLKQKVGSDHITIESVWGYGYRLEVHG